MDDILLEEDVSNQTKGSKKRRSTFSSEDILILPPKKKKKTSDEPKKPKKPERIDRAAVKREKEEARRIKGLKIKKSKQDERNEILEKLQKHALSTQEFKYYKSSSKIGQGKLTKKEALRKALAEERAGLERSDPNVELYQEREQVLDLTVPVLKDDSTEKFFEEHSDLLNRPRKAKKKKVKQPSNMANAQRKLKKQLFSIVESSSDSEGEKKRKEIKKKYQNDDDDEMMDEVSSSISSVSDIESEEEQTTKLGQKEQNLQTQSNQQISNDNQQKTPIIEQKSSDIRHESSHDSDLASNNVSNVPSTTSSSSGFVIPSFASNTSFKSKLSTAASTRRLQERKGIEVNNNETNQSISVPNTKGFVIPTFQSPSILTSSSQVLESTVSGENVQEEDQMTEEMLEELEMRKKHGLTPARPLIQFSDPKYDDARPDISEFDNPAPATQQSGVEKTAYFLTVNRTKEIDESRSKLPIVMEEHSIMDTIRRNDFVIICGETGSGKTTQVPQFLYEAGYGDPKSPMPGMIGVTEPRRVAAISTAQRVAIELNQPPPSIDEDLKKFGGDPNRQVAYQVRYDATADKHTRIKFMTDGILLREIQSDFLLNKYSAIIIDEAHERTMNTDLLLGLLCRIVPLRNQIFREKEEKERREKTEREGSNGNDASKTNHDQISSTDLVRSPLKVIIMSATLRVADFVENKRMFPLGPPPVIKIGSRQFPVTIHFNRKTSLENYVDDAFSKVVKIHTKLPEGGILVFLSGQSEIVELVRKLKRRFNSKLPSKEALRELGLEDEREEEDEEMNVDESEDDQSNDSGDSDDDSNSDDNEDDSDDQNSDDDIPDDESVDYNQEDDDNSNSSDNDDNLDSTLKPAMMEVDEDLLKKIVPSTTLDDHETTHDGSEDGGDDSNSSGDDHDDSKSKKKSKKKISKKVDPDLINSDMTVRIMPLYSMLPPREQMKIFGALPARCRLIVVATNIAETSLTIPGITYVVDSGRVKSKEYDKSTGMTSYKVDWTSQASADQRAGRAGRTGPGHCYRLFSSAVYQEFPQFSRPDILNIPIEGVVLQMKNMGIERLESFPFPTSPDLTSLSIAHKVLVSLGALKVIDKPGLLTEYQITPLGRALVNFPVSPRYAKMLILAQQSQCLPLIIAIVAALAVGDPFLHNLDREPGKADPRQTIWKSWSSKTSDLLVWLSAIGAFEYAADQESFCETYKLHLKSLREIHLLREQLTNILNSNDQIASANDIQLSEEKQYLETGKLGPSATKTLEEDLDEEEINNQNKKKQAKKLKFEAKIEPPTREQKLQIRQIIASGLLDQVAKRYPMLNERGEAVKNRFVYRIVNNLKECQIHPNSFLKATPPEYVAYNELIETHGTFLCGITAVSMGWMSTLAPWLCKKMDKILEAPSPRYDPIQDCIVGAIEPRYYYEDWIIPKLMVPLDGLDAYKYFAKCFLQGEICSQMKQFQPFLNANTDIILKVWTQEKIGLLIQPLMDKHIKSREQLYNVWKRDPNFWLSSIALWIDKAKHPQLKKAWPMLPNPEKEQNNKSNKK